MKSPLPLILLLTFLVSCTSPEERAIEATLTFAGANRAELEKVLHHYICSTDAFPGNQERPHLVTRNGRSCSEESTLLVGGY